MATSSLRDHQEILLKGLYQFYRQGELTDVTLVAGDRKFPCNRNVLAATSPYFRAMFTSQVKESEQQIITMHDVIPEVIEDILDYMYSGVIAVTDDSVQNLYIAANLFQMIPLIDMCTDHMIREISLTNCLDLYNFSSYHYNKRLKALCSTFVTENFTDICKMDHFCSSIDVEFLEFLISRDDIDIELEETVYEAVMQWVEFDIEARKHHLGRLFKHIRLPLLEKHYYLTNVATNPLLSYDTFSRTVLSYFNSCTMDNIDGINVRDVEDEEYEFQISGKRRLGMFSRNLIVFSGGAYGPTERSFTAHDPETRKNYVGIKPHPTFDFKFKLDYSQLITVLRKYIYFLGGIFYENYHFEDAGPALDTVYLYDQKTSSWVPRAHMLFPRCAFSAAAEGTKIYVTGGKPTLPKGETFDSLEVYDTEMNTWGLLEPMPLRLYHHTSTTHDGGLFVFGGQDVMDEMLECLFRYDMKSGHWAIVTSSLPKPRVEASSLVIGDKIYIIGGSHQHENALTVDIYDPALNKWKRGADFPDERKFTAVTTIDDVIYVCGGVRVFGRPGRRSRQVETKDLYKYDVEKDSWTKLIKMVQYANISTCTVAVVNYKYLTESEFISTTVEQ
ncbi:kelch-like protein 41 [Mizuhopecten yessoensis]|uniref:kelch-like protein 41 n=1 Tax=Mizuhopecten yessoensis TaxID=6573 RepID=UPI000B4576A5|nr:kelch-like protein 41 [Mizuhopecten yessoensis]XP_021366980.1 kelch-like protein 41 [Mizuhopecten yessoensis]